jgi:hypothetical protein
MNDRRLLLHIGMPKSGTTAIQRFLRRQENVQLCPRPPRVGHNGVIFLCRSGPIRSNMGRRLGIPPSEWDGAARDFVAHLKDSAQSTTILSTEFLFHRPEAKDIEAIDEALSAVFDRIEVVVYLRHQADHYASHIAQAIKSGVSCWEDARKIPDALYRYDEICDRWSARFPIIVRDYGECRHSVVPDFCRVAKIPYLEEEPERANRTLGKDSLEIIRKINELLGPDHEGERRTIVRQVECLQVTEAPVEVTDATLQCIAETYADANRRLLGRYLESPLVNVRGGG